MRGDRGCLHPQPAPRSPRHRGPRHHPQTLTFVYCQLSGSGHGPPCGPRARLGLRPSGAGGRRRVLGGAGLQGRASPGAGRPVGWSLRPHHSLVTRSLSPSESFGAGTNPRCAGRREAGGRGPVGPGAPGGVTELPAASPSGGPGRTRLPPQPPSPAAIASQRRPVRDSRRPARRTGSTFPLRLHSERGAPVPHRPSFTCPPSPSLPCLHHPQAKDCYFAAPNPVPFEYIIYFLERSEVRWFCANFFFWKKEKCV